jgi:hypothetical protein
MPCSSVLRPLPLVQGYLFLTLPHIWQGAGDRAIFGTLTVHHALTLVDLEGPFGF